ncbi:hypothetical protein AB0J80_37560 [Actinoplanes sp. NPDC049548]|uniref:hypothetical protein n=1 Tax=Actinoplanes sp. NPDC049548 TaxID=3155152 RepID=UPI0034464AC8
MDAAVGAAVTAPELAGAVGGAGRCTPRPNGRTSADALATPAKAAATLINTAKTADRRRPLRRRGRDRGETVGSPEGM